MNTQHQPSGHEQVTAPTLAREIAKQNLAPMHSTGVQHARCLYPALRRDCGGRRRRPHRRRLGHAALQMMKRNMGAHLADAADCLG